MDLEVAELVRLNRPLGYTTMVHYKASVDVIVALERYLVERYGRRAFEMNMTAVTG